MVSLSIRSRLFCSACSILAVGLAAPAPLSAQAASPAGGSATSASSDVDQAAASDADGAGEIIVTAQRRSQRLSDVPISVTAVQSKALDNAAIKDIADLSRITPGLTTTRVLGNNSPYIRGIGTSTPFTGVESAVAIYVDGVYQPASVGNIFGLNNIASIEVLKGPQGTLYGRNATGGVINVITREPQFDPTANLSVAYSNYDTVTGNAYLSGGLSSSVAADVSFYYTKQSDGFGRYVLLNKDFNTEREYNARGKLRFDLGDDTKLVIAGDYVNIDTDKGAASVPIRRAGPYANTSYYDSLSGVEPFSHIKAGGGSATLTHDFGSVDLKYIGAYRRIKSHQFFNQQNDPAANVVADFRNTESSWSQELQLSGSSKSLSWLAGLYYFHDMAVYDSPTGFKIRVLTPLGRIAVSDISSSQKLNSISGFADATLHLGEATNITGGMRFTRDSRDFFAVKNPTQAVAVIGGVPTVVSVPSALLADKKASNGRFTYRAVVDHHFTPEVMAYLSYSTGFKSGGFTGNSPTTPPLKPELIKAWEGGVKLDMLNHSLRVNAAAFHYDYTNLQISRVVGIVVQQVNAAAAKIDGAEFELFWSPVSRLDVNLGMQYLNTRYTDYQNVQSYVPIPGATQNSLGPVIDASGKDLRLAPPFTLNLSATYSIPLRSGELRLSANYSHNSGYNFYADDRVRQSPFDLFGGRIGWFSEGDRFGVSVYGRNIFQKKYYVACRCGETAGDNANYGEPRRYGIELSTKF